MHILILGATGRTGKWALQAALQQGHQVTCLARKANRIPPHKNLTVVEGNPGDADDMTDALATCDAVINVLNISRTSDFPWASLRTPKTFLSDVMSNLLNTVDPNRVKQVVICSAWGVAETRKDIPGWFRWFIDNSNIKWPYRDHERQEQLLEASALAFTIVRPVGLTNASKPQTIRESYGNDPKPSLTISRKSLGQYLVNALEREDLVGRKVVVSKG